MKKIYLAGLISTEHPESLEWRRTIKTHYPADLFLDPMSFKERLEGVSKDGGLNHPDLTASDIMLRDYGMVKSAAVILVNLNTYGCPRPMIGTWFELGWAWEHRTPVVAFAGAASNQCYLAENHPFLRCAIAHLFHTAEAAMEHAMNYYLRA